MIILFGRHARGDWVGDFQEKQEYFKKQEKGL
jgi:hypothetical protein